MKLDFFLHCIQITKHRLSMKKYFTLLRFFCCFLLAACITNSYAQNLTDPTYLKAKIAKNISRTGIPAAYLDDAYISSAYKDNRTGIEHIYLQQSFNGVEVYNQIISLAFKDDKLLYASGKFIKGIEAKAGDATPAISAQDAVVKAAAHLNLTALFTNLTIKANTFGIDKKIIFSDAGIAKKDIQTKLYWTQDSLGSLHLTWNVNIDVINKPDWWNVRVDAATGAIVQKDNWTLYEDDHSEQARREAGSNKASNSADHFFAPPPSAVRSASYYVIPFPAENINISGLTDVSNPWLNAGAGNNATTYGWQYDGATDYTITRGNNVYAYDDSANKNKPGRAVNSITPLPNLQFKATPDFAKQPFDSTNRTANTINLFYWNNLMHDVMYQYGFDEVSGNFQANNLSRGGSGNDYVLAEAQDGSGTNNANFSTPGDGSSGRMQMYLWPKAPIFTINEPASIAGNYNSVEGIFSNKNQLFKIGAITDTVVYYNVNETLGCTALPAGDTSVKGKIAFMFRGSCNFTVKVKNAQNAGAVGVIVSNNVTGDPFAMGGSDTSITIPAIMVSSDVGNSLNIVLRTDTTVTATMAPGGIVLDGDMDNGVICHEYGHGVSNRLTGGPANASCLGHAEQGGEGWSDYQALMMTTNWATAQLTDGNNARPIGNYVIGEATNGTGIRRYPYSTNLGIDPLTYANMASNTEVHAIGEIWCAALWDMTWNIIQQQGKIETNLYNSAGNGGNAIALQLVLEGMKLQPCTPGFLDARNAILAADSILYGYKHKCAIWNAFAGRGMGVSASQGSVNSATDQVAAYDAPGVTLAKTTEPVIAQGKVTENLTVTCGCNLPSGSYTLTDTLPSKFTYVSSTGGTLQDSVVTFPLSFSAPLEVKTLSVTFTPNVSGCNIDTVVYDDRDAHTTGGFTSVILQGKVNWSVSTVKSYSPTHSWYAKDADSATQYELLSGTFKPSGLSTLSFWHYVNTEYSYDGGIVELQADGGNWINASPYITKNGYNAILNKTNANQPQEPAFSGTPFPTFSQSLIDLSSFTDKNMTIRFRMRSDSFAGVDGWYLDNITVANGCGGMQKIGLYNNSAKVDAFGIPTYIPSSILPLSLVSFTAVSQGNSSLLSWQTATEVNTKAFIIEVSKDGSLFAAIGSVPAKGQSANTYTLTDLNPYKGLNYYRIKMVDRDGSFTYSPVRTVLFTGKSFIVVKPNPATNSTTVYFDKEMAVSYISITDMQGKIIKQISAKNMFGSYTLNTSDFAAGIYLIKIIPVVGAPSSVKLVVQHQ